MSRLTFSRPFDAEPRVFKLAQDCSAEPIWDKPQRSLIGLLVLSLCYANLASPHESLRAETTPARPGIKQPQKNPNPDELPIGEDGVRPGNRPDPIDEEAVRLRLWGQQHFVRADYASMAATYSELTDRAASTIDDLMWLGHAHQLARNWPTAVQAYHQALKKLDAEIASTEAHLKELERLAKVDESIKFEKGSRYPFLKRAQEELPKQWPDLVLQIGHLELVELKNPAAAAKTLSQGLRFYPQLAVPLDQLMMSAEAASQQKWDPKDGHRALAYIDPLETQRYMAMAQEQLDQPAEAFDTWTRVRLCKIQHHMSYADTDPVHLADLAAKLPSDALRPHHHYALKNPDRAPLKQREATGFLKSGTANPFQARMLTGFDFNTAGPTGASLAKLRDGRWLMAHATGDHHLHGIKLSLSKDGKDGISWEAPWEFTHNSVFNTRAPSLLVDDNGLIWMLCLSKRLTTERFASAPYELWLTHSSNGREWSPLRVLQLQSDLTPPAIATAQYQEIPQLLRLPGDRFGIIWKDHFGAAKSPGKITTLRPLPLPKQDPQPLVTNTQATFESNGRCHLVFDDFGRGVYYTRSDDLQTWLPLQRLGVAEKNSSISMPQLLMEGDHVALLHEKNNGVWLQRGTTVPDGLKLGDPLQITDHLMPLHGSRLRQDGDRVLVPAGTPPYVPNLLSASFADLLGPP